MTYDTIIIGNGPAGLTAGIYSARSGLKTLVIGESLGGQASEAHLIGNYPGFKEIPGPELMKRFEDHAKSLDVECVYGHVKDIDAKDDRYIILTEDNRYETRTVILALGKKARHLNIQGEDNLIGRGVSYCATCDGAFFKGKDVAVIGGGNAALSSALYLTGVASKVYVVHRRDEFRGETIKLEQLKKHDNVEFVLNATPKRILGDKKVESLAIEKDGADDEKIIKVDGVFIEIGSVPSTALTNKLGIEHDQKGYIKVDKAQRTNKEGIFAAGDVTDASNMLWQVITACSEGAIASDSAFKYIKERTE